MKKIIALLLAILMLLASCGPATGSDTTVSGDITDEPPVTEPPVKNDRVDYTIDVTEDTYVLDKDKSGDHTFQNYSDEKEFIIKTGNNGYKRYGYLKFDISKLAEDTDFTSIEVDLALLPGQTFAVSNIEVYGCDPTCDLKTLTFNTQPESLGFICAVKNIAPDCGIVSFPITDYVRYAVGKGHTEIVLMFKEISDEKPNVNFMSKEYGETSPKLSVYYGTKIDNKTFVEGGDSLGEPEISKTGLDAIFGQHKLSDNTVYVMEDSYTEAGGSADTNFGDSDLLDFKGSIEKPSQTYRVILLKFDIKDLPKDYEKINLRLFCNYMETAGTSTPVHLYGYDPYSWEEKSVTYNTIPEREEKIASATVSRKGWINFDVTEYIDECINNGEKIISFYLEGEQETCKRLKFNSKESGSNIPCLRFNNDELNFSTYLKYKEQNPWQVAMDGVTEWLSRWEEIKNKGDYDTYQVVMDKEEYSLSVDSANAADTDGYNTKYTTKPTRLISTLKGYKASTAEVAKYDEYGGLMDDSMKQEATGFFYVKKIGDRWWNIDPLGYPMFRVSVTSVSTGSPLQKERLLEKYGSIDKWAQATNDRFRELGFNSFGGFTSIESFANTENVLTLTKNLGVMSGYTSKISTNISDSGSTKITGGLIPSFDPDFATYAESNISSSVAKYADSPDVYGWMSDNELQFGATALDNALDFDPANATFAYSYAAAWTFMYLKTGKADVSTADVTDELRDEFVAMLADKYFSVVVPLIKKYDPNHMYIGCRFHGSIIKDEYFMRVAGYWCDAITYNYYRAWTPDFEDIANMIKWAGKPLVVTEFYAKGMDVWEKDNRLTNKSGAGWTVRTQEDRGRFYQNFGLALLECKDCVGFDWFKYIDNDPENLKADLSNRNANKGVVDNYGNEYTELTKYMQELNHQKYNLIQFFDER